jgi:hypothetical protein
MKKLIEIAYKTQLAAQILIMSIAFVMFIFSCNKETPQPTNKCNCTEVTYIKWVYTQGQWAEDSRGNVQQLDCWKHGEITSEWTSSQAGNLQYWKKQIECE